jgi:hypothetical protein
MPEQIVRRSQIGEVGVDTGQVIICDPANIDSWVDHEYSDGPGRTHEFSYDGACRESGSRPDRGGWLKIGSTYCTVAESGYGDGVYPVYADYNRGGHIVRLVIYFSDCEKETREE